MVIRNVIKEDHNAPTLNIVMKEYKSGGFGAFFGLIIIFVLTCLIICACTACIIVLWSCMIRHNRYRHYRGRGWGGQIREHLMRERTEKRKKIIEQILKENKEFDFNEDKIEFGQNACTICQCDFVNGEKIWLLPGCKHVFHSECIVEWLKRSEDQPNHQFIQHAFTHFEIPCPNCKQPIKTLE